MVFNHLRFFVQVGFSLHDVTKAEHGTKCENVESAGLLCYSSVEYRVC